MERANKMFGKPVTTFDGETILSLKIINNGVGYCLDRPLEINYLLLCRLPILPSVCLDRDWEFTKEFVE